MKIHTKKKAYRAWLKSEAKAGKFHNADGKIINRREGLDNSMRRDYHPQALA